jgi:chloramphenicol-sensitive protein RarD
VMGEPMPLERWIGFSLVWIGLIMLSADALRHRRDRIHNLSSPQ